MRNLGTVLLVCAVGLAASDAAAQRDRGRSRDSDRPMTEDEIAQRVAGAESFLRRMDTNNNGMIDTEEVSGGQRFFVERMFQRMGAEPKFPISISQIQQSLGSYYRNRSTSGGGSPPSGGSRPGGPPSDGGSSRFGGPPGSSDGRRFGDPRFGGDPRFSGGSPRFGGPGMSGPMYGGPGMSGPMYGGPGMSGPMPGAPGFGVPNPGPTGFGATSVAPSAPGVPPTSPTPPPTDASIDGRVRAVAGAYIQKNDKDGNAKLDRNEWPVQATFGKFDEANRSGGSYVTLDELVTHLLDLVKRGLLSLDSLASGDGSQRKSLRFLTPTERLPKGLPEWFASRDANGDGQVTMGEFTKEWSSEKAQEFSHYDRNQDGIVTANECLKADKAKEGEKHHH